MSADAKHEHSWNVYYVVFNALIALTVVTVAISYFDLGEMITAGNDLLRSIKVGPLALEKFVPEFEVGHGANILLGLFVAVIKASLVIWYFMHQKYEEGLNRLAFSFCIGLFFLALVAFSFDFVWLGTYVVEGLAGAAVGGH